MAHHDKSRGFSLVELSIVLVILGLLVGGILAGQSLIRASELRSVTTESDRYRTAMFAFRDKYFALPGDMTNATRFWGDDNTNCPDPAITNGTPGTCNGDGNGQWNEVFRTWQHLALAGLIEGSYTGTATGGTAVAGTNVPNSKLNNGAWGLWPYSLSAWLGWRNSETANWIVLGSYYATNQSINAAIKPEEAWNIDTKSDDGRPATGSVVAGTGYDLYLVGLISCTSGAGPSTTYSLTTASTACGMAFRLN